MLPIFLLWERVTLIVTLLKGVRVVDPHLSTLIYAALLIVTTQRVRLRLRGFMSVKLTPSTPASQFNLCAHGLFISLSSSLA
jgi:hypothetical protein